VTLVRPRFDKIVSERIGVRELNQQTSRVLARVREGTAFEVTERGEPISRLIPIGSDSALDRLVAEGRATAPAARGAIPVPPVLGDPGVDVAADLSQARDQERW